MQCPMQYRNRNLVSPIESMKNRQLDQKLIPAAHVSHISQLFVQAGYFSNKFIANAAQNQYFVLNLASGNIFLFNSW